MEPADQNAGDGGMSVTRRTWGAMAVAAAALGLAACSGAAPAAAQQGDMALGAADAKVTVIEYASMTCGGCAQFHVNDFPKLKTEFIDTGKIRYILREYPGAGYSPQIAMAQFLLARCIATDAKSYSDVVSAMFRQFEATYAAAQAGTVRQHLMQFAQSAGLSPERFNACVTDQAAMERINATQKAGIEQFKIERTPSFIINGQLVEPNTFEGIKPLIEAQLAK
jgi:protein-disulfide isomerase